MFCKECRTENLETQVKCIKCETIINSNLPLDGESRVKIIAFFVIMILPFAWLGTSIIILLITITSLYIMKKDKSFIPILNAKEYVKKYLIFGVVIAVVVIFSIMIYNTLYYSFDGDSIGLIILLIFPAIIGILFMFICNKLFFKPLEEHKEWVIHNGIFSDNSNQNKESILEKVNKKAKEIKKEPSINIDKLQKFAELRSEGLITEDEFMKLKEKIFEGNL